MILLSISTVMSLLRMKHFDEREGLTVLQNFLLSTIPFSVAFSKYVFFAILDNSSLESEISLPYVS